MDESWPIVSCYSRTQALADGVLIDISEIAYQSGFRLPTAITATLNAELGSEEATLELLYRFLQEIVTRKKFNDEEIVLENIRDDDAILHIGPGDRGEPVLTLMRPLDR